MEIRYGEWRLSRFEKVFRELPADHAVGLINVMFGQGATCHLLELLTRLAAEKHFTVMSTTVTRSAKEIFDGFIPCLTKGANLQ